MSERTVPRGLVVLLLATLVVLLLSVVGLVGYWYGKREVKPVATPTTSQDGSSRTPQSRFPEKPSPQPVDETAGWKTYTNVEYNYEIRYPPGWEFKVTNYTGYQHSLGLTGDKSFVDFFINKGLSGGNVVYGKVRPCLDEQNVRKDNGMTDLVREISVAGVMGYEAGLPGGHNDSQDLICFEQGGVRYDFQLSPGSVGIGTEDMRSEVLHKIVSTFRFLDQRQGFSCEQENVALTTLVSNFEELQKKRNPNAVLALFTPAESVADKDTYKFLSGGDAAGPRLYNSGQTNFQLGSYEVIGLPVERANLGCEVNVEEKRAFYKEGIGGWNPAGSYKLTFVLMKVNNEWKIEQYLGSGKTGKYSGW